MPQTNIIGSIKEDEFLLALDANGLARELILGGAHRGDLTVKETRAGGHRKDQPRAVDIRIKVIRPAAAWREQGG